MTVDNELIRLCIDEYPPRNQPLVAKYIRYSLFCSLLKKCLNCVIL